MLDKQTFYKLQFIALIALIMMLVGAFTAKSGEGMIPEGIGMLFPFAGLVLILVVVYRYGILFAQAEKKPDQKDVFEYTTKDTSPKVLGRLAELKFGERKSRPRIEDYYAVKKP